MRLEDITKDMSEDCKNLNCDALGLTPETIKAQASPSGRGKGQKASKFGNVRTELNGRTYASGREAARAAELQLMEKGKEIFGLCYQVRLPLAGGVVYVADFLYSEVVAGKLVTIVEDSKGWRTPEYKIKKKLVKERYGIEIKES